MHGTCNTAANRVEEIGAAHFDQEQQRGEPRCGMPLDEIHRSCGTTVHPRVGASGPPGNLGLLTSEPSLRPSVPHASRCIRAAAARCVVTVLTAHKVLISSAVALFVLYAGRELRNYANGDSSALLRSGVSGVAAVGLAIYLRWVWVHRPGDRSP